MLLVAPSGKLAASRKVVNDVAASYQTAPQPHICQKPDFLSIICWQAQWSPRQPSGKLLPRRAQLPNQASRKVPPARSIAGGQKPKPHNVVRVRWDIVGQGLATRKESAWHWPRTSYPKGKEPDQCCALAAYSKRLDGSTVRFNSAFVAKYARITASFYHAQGQEVDL